jgi:hypothetical protein
VFELAKIVRSGYANVSVVEQVLFPPAQATPKYKGLVRMPPCDLSQANGAGSTVLTLLFQEWEHRYRANMWTVATMLCEQHGSELSQADLFARNKHGQCALGLLAEEARKVVTPAAQSWKQREVDMQKKLPQRLLQAWQAARSPAVRSVQPAFIRGARAGSLATGLLSSNQLVL